MIGASLALGIVVLCLAVVIRKFWNFNWRVKKPASRLVTLFDVRELLTKGEKTKAIKAYRQIFKVDFKEAQQAVDALEKNMHQQG